MTRKPQRVKPTPGARKVLLGLSRGTADTAGAAEAGRRWGRDGGAGEPSQ